MNENKVADTILSWDTEDELSDEEEIFSGAVRDEEEVSPANIYTESDFSNGEKMMTQTLSLLYLLSACWAEMALRENAPIQ